MNHLATAAAPRPKADAWFFPVMTAVVWLGVIMGFGGEMVRQSRAGDLTYPLIVHIHALVFTGWLVVFTAQVVFIRQGRFGLHRTLGLAAMALAGVMLVLGPATALIVQVNRLGSPAADPAFLAVSMSDMISFAGLVCAGFINRAKGALHKRLMLLSTLALADAGFGRWSFALLGQSLQPVLGDGFACAFITGCGFSALALLAPMFLDLVMHRRISAGVAWATAWAIGWLVVATSLYPNPVWKALAGGLVAWLGGQ
ncbi:MULTISPECIES: hypothetical protein [unclassified Brevundimonas]|jgi:hypothetical protein|uniref:hypothetical protein n=1 Tax=Brevundimonas TaxID=41275 RepID=UPI000A9539E9|nr:MULTISPECIES: hypothetical protein [unclassified Brevundimonas]QFU30332.1 hypothetical protein BSP_01520 [Brevundimonas sp. Bb-A]HAF80185.1 hypothetical protein [Brevundimonas sp.]